VTIDEVLAQARAALDRVTPQRADELRRSGALLVDIRPHANRLAEGEIPDSVPIERIVLEWRLDPAGAHRLPGFTADTPVVVLTSRGAEEVAVEAMKAGAADYVLKPFSMDEIRLRIRRLMAILASGWDQVFRSLAAQTNSVCVPAKR